MPSARWKSRERGDVMVAVFHDMHVTIKATKSNEENAARHFMRKHS